MKKIILASASPRRKEILSKYNCYLKIIEADIMEKINADETPEQIAMSLAFQKAFLVSQKAKKDEIIIGADTLVCLDDKILGKPKNNKDAFKMLKILSGREHKVITGIAIIEAGSNIKVIDYDITLVKFRELSDLKIRKYINTGEPLDKAGSYGIQGYGEILVEKINGSYSNVVGLPIAKLDNLLNSLLGFSILN